MTKSIIGRKAGRVSSKDGRSAEAVLFRRTRAALTEHVGTPTVTQRMLIDRAAHLAVQIARLDAIARDAGSFSDWASRQYLAWCGAHRRTLQALGLEAPAKAQEGAPAGTSDLAAYLAEKAASGAAHATGAAQ